MRPSKVSPSGADAAPLFDVRLDVDALGVLVAGHLAGELVVVVNLDVAGVDAELPRLEPVARLESLVLGRGHLRRGVGVWSLQLDALVGGALLDVVDHAVQHLAVPALEGELRDEWHTRSFVGTGKNAPFDRWPRADGTTLLHRYTH